MTEKQETTIENNSRRPTKNEKRRMKKKETKKIDEAEIKPDLSKVDKQAHSDEFDVDGVEVEYVAPELVNDIGLEEEVFEEYKRIFTKMATGNMDSSITASHKSDENRLVEVSTDGQSSEEIKTDENNGESKKLSKRKKKLLSRLSVSELKQLVSRPDVVEAHDVTSSDPRLLVFLKAYRNTVAVPRHWCYIRKYLQGKRGIEKIPYQLPEFIAETGIAKIRDAVLEQEALKKSKQKARERTRPKMGKIDIDYQVLHDAFFKYQTKSKLSGAGDLYYEGKEFEVSFKFSYRKATR
jgi:splicing factor 3B subunit 2